MDDQPNLDLINLVQQARMAHDAEAQPSQIAAVYWIEVKPKTPGAAPTPRAGFWLIRTTVSEVDARWVAIRAATEAGKLGYKSKVATAARDHADERVIRVMTYDADDRADVARVGDALREMGFTDATYERET